MLNWMCLLAALTGCRAIVRRWKSVTSSSYEHWKFTFILYLMYDHIQTPASENACSALFLLMIESECELHLNSTYILTQLSDESESFSTYRQIFFLCINSSLIWLFIKFFCFCFFFKHNLGGCSVWLVAGSQSTPDGQTLNSVIKYEYFIYNTESNPLVHPHVET